MMPQLRNALIYIPNLICFQFSFEQEIQSRDDSLNEINRQTRKGNSKGKKKKFDIENENKDDSQYFAAKI